MMLDELVRVRKAASNGAGRALRRRAGLSLRELADLIDVDPATLSRWERGAVRPRHDAALRWSNALDAITAALNPPGSASGPSPHQNGGL